MATTHVLVDLKGVEVEVTVKFNPGWYRPAKLSGHPDNWEPADGEPAEIEEIKLHLASGRVLDVESRLAYSEIKKIQEVCNEGGSSEPDYDPREDDDYDDPRDNNVDCGTDSNGRDRDYGKY